MMNDCLSVSPCKNQAVDETWYENPIILIVYFDDLHHQNQGKQKNIFPCWTIEFQFHWNKLKMNISRADNSVKNIIFPRSYWQISEQIQWCKDQIMVFSYRESIYEWDLIVRSLGFWHACFWFFSHFAWFLQTLTLKIFRSDSWLKQQSTFTLSF